MLSIRELFSAKAFFLVLAVCFSALFASPVQAEVSINLASPNLSSSEPGGYVVSPDGNKQLITIKGTDDYVLSGNGGSNNYRVLLNRSSTYGDGDITLSNVTLSSPTNERSPFAIWGGENANISLSGNTLLRGGGGGMIDNYDNYSALLVLTGNLLTISGTGSLTAIGNSRTNLNFPGAGIGGGGKITIRDGVVTATGGDDTGGSDSSTGAGAGIGGSGSTSSVTVGEIAITGGKVTANGGFRNTRSGAGIGTGGGGNSGSGKIAITGGTVKATGGGNGGGAGIGSGGENTTNLTIEIRRGAVTADGGSGYPGGGAGIGGSHCKIEITGGVVTANGGGGSPIGGAGIGSNATGEENTIRIESSFVKANGGDSATQGAPGIGDLLENCPITINNSVVFAAGGTGGAGQVAGILGRPLSITNSVIFDNGVGTVYGNAVLSKDILSGDTLLIPEGMTLTVPAGATLTVPTGVTLTVSEHASLNNEGIINNDGTIVNWGSLDRDGNGSGEIVGGGYIRDEEPPTDPDEEGNGGGGGNNSSETTPTRIYTKIGSTEYSADWVGGPYLCVLPSGTPVTALAFSFDLPAGAKIYPPSGTFLDFSVVGQKYTVTAGDEKTLEYIFVDVTRPDDVTRPEPIPTETRPTRVFTTVNGQNVNATWSDGAYLCILPLGTDMASLAFSFELPEGATISPDSGTLLNFSAAGQEYTITAGGKQTKITVIATQADPEATPKEYFSTSVNDCELTDDSETSKHASLFIPLKDAATAANIEKTWAMVRLPLKPAAPSNCQVTEGSIQIGFAVESSQALKGGALDRIYYRLSGDDTNYYQDTGPLLFSALLAAPGDVRPTRIYTVVDSVDYTAVKSNEREWDYICAVPLDTDITTLEFRFDLPKGATVSADYDGTRFAEAGWQSYTITARDEKTTQKVVVYVTQADPEAKESIYFSTIVDNCSFDYSPIESDDRVEASLTIPFMFAASADTVEVLRAVINLPLNPAVPSSYDIVGIPDNPALKITFEADSVEDLKGGSLEGIYYRVAGSGANHYQNAGPLPFSRFMDGSRRGGGGGCNAGASFAAFAAIVPAVLLFRPRPRISRKR
jgi:hypothetical protein